jgi:hypothetical protein
MRAEAGLCGGERESKKQNGSEMLFTARVGDGS